MLALRPGMAAAHRRANTTIVRSKEYGVRSMEYEVESKEFPAPYSLLPTPYSLLLTPYSPTPYILLPSNTLAGPPGQRLSTEYC